jgi:CRP-like cAMP-binding protein
MKVANEDQAGIGTLAEHYLFASFSESQLKRITDCCRSSDLKTGETLFYQGDRARNFYLVESGQIKLCLNSRDGNQKIVEVVYPGQTFAEAVAFMTGHRYPVSAQAIVAARLTVIPSFVYLEMLAESNESCFRLLGDISRRLHARLREIEMLTLENATHRLVRFLAHKTISGDNKIRLNLSRQDIAARLSIKPETLSRIIRGLIDEGIINVDGKDITILNRKALAEYE